MSKEEEATLSRLLFNRFPVFVPADVVHLIIKYLYYVKYEHHWWCECPNCDSCTLTHVPDLFTVHQPIERRKQAIYTLYPFISRRQFFRYAFSALRLKDLKWMAQEFNVSLIDAVHYICCYGCTEDAYRKQDILCKMLSNSNIISCIQNHTNLWKAGHMLKFPRVIDGRYAPYTVSLYHRYALFPYNQNLFYVCNKGSCACNSFDLPKNMKKYHVLKAGNKNFYIEYHDHIYKKNNL